MGSKNFRSEWNFGSERLSKKIYVRRYFMSKKIFGLKNTGPEKFLGLKNLGSVKILSMKKLEIQNNSWSKKLLDSKIFRVWKFFWPKIIAPVLGLTLTHSLTKLNTFDLSLVNFNFFTLPYCLLGRGCHNVKNIYRNV